MLPPFFFKIVTRFWFPQATILKLMHVEYCQNTDLGRFMIYPRTMYMELFWRWWIRSKYVYLINNSWEREREKGLGERGKSSQQFWDLFSQPQTTLFFFFFWFLFFRLLQLIIGSHKLLCKMLRAKVTLREGSGQLWIRQLWGCGELPHTGKWFEAWSFLSFLGRLREVQVHGIWAVFPCPPLMVLTETPETRGGNTRGRSSCSQGGQH